MTDNQTPPEQQEPLIPPVYLLGIGLGGLFLALLVGISQPELGALGFGALGIGLLSLVAWALLAPQQAVAVLTGRTARFGGVSFFVTILLIAALIVVYIFVRNQEVRLDLTESDAFSLTEESRAAVAPFASDPNVPRIRVLAFFSASQADVRERVDLLLSDYQEATGGKVDYQLIDIDRQPGIASLYGVTAAGQAVVVKDNPALAGQPIVQDPAAAATDSAFSIQTYQPDETGFTADVDNAETITSITQQNITNAILRVAADGDFKAYVVNVQNGVADRLSVVRQVMQDGFGWTVEDLSLITLTAPETEIQLNDPNLDGEVMIIPGGSAALTPEELAVVQDYLNAGGDLVLYAGDSFNDSLTSLAVDPVLNEYLFTTFGIRINNDVVLDDRQAAQSALSPVALEGNLSHPITAEFLQPVFIFDLARSLTISDTPPPNVTVTPLVSSSENAWTTTEFTAIVNNEYEAPADIVRGPQVLAAVAENTVTGARLVVFSSVSPVIDDYLQYQNVNNLQLSVNAVVWMTGFDSFARQITVDQPVRPQDQPMFITQQQLRDVNLLTVFVLPFGVLAIGVYVWWANRERRRS